MPIPFNVIVMGVAGSGKTTVGTALADTLGVDFHDGDDYQPAENVAKMQAGIPLTDADRDFWLRHLQGLLDEHQADPIVLACSALKQTYRDRLRSSGTVCFIFLELDIGNARARMAARADHFMPATLIDSQFAALEPPADEPDVITVDASNAVSEIVDLAISRLTGPERSLNSASTSGTAKPT
jgi:gluconokinase